MKKVGFQYYKVDTDRYDDVRIRKLRRSFGTKGIAVYDYILAQAYRYHGCYVICNDDCIFNVSEYFDIKEDVVKQIIDYCGEVGLFDKELLSRDSIITSHAIQVRFAEMCKSAKRLYVEIPSSILLVSRDEICDIPIRVVQSVGTSDSENENEIPENFRKKSKIPEKTRKTPEETHISIESKVKYNSVSTNADTLSDFNKSDDAVQSTLFGDEVKTVPKEEQIDYDEIVRFWNESTKGIYGRLTRIEHTRKKMTYARIKEYGREAFMQAMRYAAQSEYLKSVAWFSFDWMIKPNNFPKVLENKYGLAQDRTQGDTIPRADNKQGGGEAGRNVTGTNIPPVRRKRVYE